ncbi:RDD family protein [Xanthomonas arboricola]|uniref:RDD family protein n=2 Tax=Xanthomonas arboricola TaxID=56448 RepID=UPI0009B6BD2D|nr:RDD family protein [Xanthomonas arboricola]MDN0222495.1 RDD family protein [Xanthomonas arboricola pv. juglandis]MDN0226711.1 RDD family protein [Xanthomonas arboricola pv. juglandis]MDN0230992.1 RDD family protein [Xanthomonas arboricola pv. juglandis]MDN0235246.1 RDD family protein [Xanthomonas arboricola pv. juglandis]MDN0239494.1 RDD family protein [Xanthomonas arboricola pv. juglandis]
MEVDTAPGAAGFWRRSAAFLVDCLVLGMAGALAGWALLDVFVRMGGYGRLVGFFVALTYFGVMNSVLCKGQTLGKRLLGVRVAGKDDALLALPQSLLRYSVLGVPFFLNGAQFDRDVLLSPLQHVLTLLIFGGTLSILYLYLFNRRGRRSLHDLAVGSSVVTAQTPLAAVGPMPVWRVHLVVVAVLMIAAAAVPAFTGQLAQSDYFKDLLAAHEAVSAEPGVQSARVVHNTVFGTPNVESVVVQVNLSERRIDDKALGEHIARVVLANDKKAAAMSAIRVTLVYGYDLGIASSWRSMGYQFAPKALAAAGESDAAARSGR